MCFYASKKETTRNNHSTHLLFLQCNEPEKEIMGDLVSNKCPWYVFASILYLNRTIAKDFLINKCIFFQEYID